MGRRVITTKDIEILETVETFATEEKASHDYFSHPVEEEKKIFISAQTQIDDYKTKLIKYIPAEIVAAFVSVDAIIKSVTQPSILFYWIIFAILLLFTPLYIWRVTNVPDKPPAKTQIFVSTISFIVWVFALGGPFNYLGWYRPYYGALLLPIWTLAIPIIGRK